MATEPMAPSIGRVWAFDEDQLVRALVEHVRMMTIPDASRTRQIIEGFLLSPEAAKLRLRA